MGGSAGSEQGCAKGPAGTRRESPSSGDGAPRSCLLFRVYVGVLFGFHVSMKGRGSAIEVTQCNGQER